MLNPEIRKAAECGSSVVGKQPETSKRFDPNAPTRVDEQLVHIGTGAKAATAPQIRDDSISGRNPLARLVANQIG